MSLSCSFDGGDYDGAEWRWLYTLEHKPLRTKRGRKCCSCEAPINPGDLSLEVERYRGPNHDIEESIYGDEVPLASWFMCETCGDLALSLHELKFCFDLDTPLKDQIKEYREQEAAEVAAYKELMERLRAAT
jgi:hypothetical protein